MFVTSEGSVYGRFRRALDTGNARIALAAAADLPQVGLADALEVSRSCSTQSPRGLAGGPALARPLLPRGDERDLAEAQAVLACLAGLRGARPEPAAHALADLLHRRDLAQASEALDRWGRH